METETTSESIVEANNVPSTSTQYFHSTFIKVEHSDDDNEGNGNESADSDWVDDQIKEEMLSCSSSEEDRGQTKRIKLARLGKKMEKKRGQVAKGTSGEAGTSESDLELDLDPSIKNERKGLCNAYNPQFKLQVLSYAERHSTCATAAKFKLTPKRIKVWKSSRSKIEEERDGSSQRRARGSCYSIEQRLEAVAFAEAHTIDEAKVLYDVHARTIEKWRQKKMQMQLALQKGKGELKRSVGGGRKPGYSHIENDLRDWVVQLRARAIPVTYEMILTRAKILVNNASSSPEHNVQAPSTRSWVIGFLSRHNLVGQLGLTFGQPDHPHNFLSQFAQFSGATVDTQNVDVPESKGKRLRRTISLQDKVSIIERIQSGETQMDIVRSSKLSHSTVQTIWSSKDTILANFATCSSSNGGSYVQLNAFGDVNKPLHHWLQKCISTNVSVDGKMLLDKTLEICSSLNKSNYEKHALKWLKRFCKQHKLSISLAHEADCSGALRSVKLESSKHGPGPHNQARSDGKNGSNYYSQLGFESLKIGQNLNLHSSDLSSESAFLQGTYDDNVAVDSQISGDKSSSFTASANSLACADAMKHVTLLRNWITDNYGSEQTLLAHLDAIENAVAQKTLTINFLPSSR